MKVFKRFAISKETSLSTKLRRKRFALFKNLISTAIKPLRILDVGGTLEFWEMMGFTNESDIEIVLLNLSSTEVSNPNFKGISGDARDLSQIKDNAFDIVFSNSLIEHVGSYDDQRRTADEIKRVGKRYFVQTPNYYFPIEPHFLFPFCQYFPLGLRALLIRNFNLGWHKKITDLQKARSTVSGIRLLKKKELKELFPGSVIYHERFFGLTKSFIAYGGWK
jgi:hypothetical protein